MINALRKTSKIILLATIIIVIYYYRTCVRVLQDESVDHINLLLHITMVMFLFIGFFSWRNKRINQSFMAKNILLLSIIIIGGNIINWQGNGPFINTVLWCVYFMVFFMYYSSKNDENIIKIAFTIICLITLVTGYLTMNIASVVNQSSSNNNYDTFINIVGFSVTTIPAVMTLKKQVLKWAIFFSIAVVAVVTARRMALICVAMIVILSFFEARGGGNKSYRWLSIVFLIVFIYFGCVFLLSNLSDNLETALLRLSVDDVMTSEGTGRFTVWNDVLNSIGNSGIFSFIIGHGTYGVMSFTQHSAAHNDLLEFLYDYGFIGFILLLVLNVNLIKRVIRLFKEKSDYRFSYFMSYFVFLIYGTFGDVLIYPQYCLPLVSYWGYMEAKFISEKKQEQQF